MSRGTTIALVIFVVGCVGLMGWLLFADGPGAKVSTEAPTQLDHEVAPAAVQPPVPKRPARQPTAKRPIRQPTAKRPNRQPAAKRPPPPPPVARAAATTASNDGDQDVDIEGNLDPADARAVSRFVLPRVRRCFADYRLDHPNSRGQLRVEVGVHNNGAVAALLNDSRLAEDPFADPALDLCIRRALNGKAVAVGALAIDARVALPISLGH